MAVWDTRNPGQVTSVGVVDADLGVGNRRLIVLSGIVVLNWRYDSDVIWRGEERVLLGVYARNIEQWSAYIGLASIANDESEFVFATDNARIELDPATGELILVVNTALSGEWSALNRFSYQVVVTVVRIGAAITGRITWPTALFRPESQDPAIAQRLFSVVANRYEYISATSNTFAYEKLTPLIPGAVEKLVVGEDHCDAFYRITNPPMATDLKVTLGVADEFRAQSPGVNIAWGQSKGPQHFVLSPAHPAEEVDFAIGEGPQVR
jgi:hypothetical protein